MTSPTPTILIVDDDDAVTASLSLLLKQAGYRSVCAASPDEALRALEVREQGSVGPPCDLMLQDMNFSRRTTGEEGLALLRRVREKQAGLPIILMTAWGSIELAVQGMRAGAQDFITKPWSNDQILYAVRTALGLAAHRRERSLTGAGARGREPSVRADLEARWDLSGVVGESPAFLDALDIAARVAATDASVLITGNSGTGKEVVAEFIHRNSGRRDGPFVRVNLGGVPTTLFESEMFGHVKGAFTDAHADRVGRFAEARGGTILLDEIGELDAACQVKMLRVLQDRTYEVLGSSKQQVMDARVVAATNRDLGAAIRAGRFREDLYYRINLITIGLPRLAERPEDIPILARHFVSGIGRAYGRPELSIDDGALDWLRRQPWPGNVRQLKHVIERAALVSELSRLSIDDVRRALDASATARDDDWVPPVGSVTVEDMEKAMILKSIEHHDGNLSRVAESLGLSRQALYRRLEKFGIRF